MQDYCDSLKHIAKRGKVEVLGPQAIRLSVPFYRLAQTRRFFESMRTACIKIEYEALSLSEHFTLWTVKVDRHFYRWRRPRVTDDCF